MFFLISSPSLALYYSLSGFLVVLLWYLYSTGTGTRVLEEFDGKSLATGAVRPKGRFSVGSFGASSIIEEKRNNN